MFLGLLVSCNKKIKYSETFIMKTGLRKFIGLIIEACESAKYCGQIDFLVLFWNIFSMFSENPLQFFLDLFGFGPKFRGFHYLKLPI